MTPALELQNVHKSFGKTAIIRGCSLVIQPRECVALIGPNGAGKSTLIHLISGKLQPTGGNIVLKGKRINSLTPHAINRLGLARSFQVTHLFPTLSVFDNLRCAVLRQLGYGYALFRRVSQLDEVTERTQAILALMQLTHQQNRPAAHLAYAEQRALELGMTLASGADTLLLDEPTAGMSQSQTQHFIELIKTTTSGKTLLIVEHDMSVVFALAHRIAVLVEGQLLAFDTPQAVRANPRVQAAYLGLGESTQ